MAVVIKHEHLADVDSSGNPIMYIEGTYEAGDTLPTENIYQGSWMLEITAKDTVKFYDSESGTWR